MTQTEDSMESVHGSIVHVELYSDDPGSTRTFLESVFGWTFEDVDGRDYVLWRAPNPPGGGLMAPEEGQFTPPPTLCYIDVDDLAEANEAIVDAGGELVVEEMEVPGMGAFSLFREPGGVVEAAWEDRYAGDPPEGGWPEYTEDVEPGSVVHFELYTEDLGATRTFHEEVFGWTFESIGDGEYILARPPTPPYGGLMPASEEMPPETLVYVLVDSAAEAVGTVADAGGVVLREPFEIEGWGTMAVFEAPGGIVQALWES